MDFTALQKKLDLRFYLHMSLCLLVSGAAYLRYAPQTPSPEESPLYVSIIVYLSIGILAYGYFNFSRQLKALKSLALKARFNRFIELYWYKVNYLTIAFLINGILYFFTNSVHSVMGIVGCLFFLSIDRPLLSKFVKRLKLTDEDKQALKQP